MANQKDFLNLPAHHIPDLNYMVTGVSQELFKFQAAQWKFWTIHKPEAVTLSSLDHMPVISIIVLGFLAIFTGH